MKTILLSIHLAAMGVWLGCVLTEALFERALLGKSREHELLLSALHKRVDIIVEIPAFIVVLVTGWIMLPSAASSSLLLTKVASGLVAMAANVFCVGLVFKRYAAASANNWDVFARLDRLQHKVGAVVLIGILGAMSVGFYLYARA